jgi:hypothetical protein
LEQQTADCAFGFNPPYALQFRLTPTQQRSPHPTARFVTIATRPFSRVKRAESHH